MLVLVQEQERLEVQVAKTREALTQLEVAFTTGYTVHGLQ